MKCVRIGYYNVTFDLIVKTENDVFLIEHLVKQIDNGRQFQMRDINEWCISHGIDHKTSFAYRKDFPVISNLWNLYSYWRFCVERKKEIEQSS